MIDIKDISGKILFSVQENDETVFVEELMSSDYIRLSWHSDKGDSIPVSSYIEYDGEKYRLLETYTPQMENEAEYVYTPEFNSRVIAWGKQIVPVYTYDVDGTTVKTREMDWEFTGSPLDAMFMVKQAIKNETGEDWTVQLSDGLPATISISSQSSSIFSVLNSIADECETEWWTDKNTNTLYLSKCVKGDPITLEVGKQVGVPSVTDNSEGYYTRFYAFGSTRNIVQESLEGGASVNKRLTLDPVKYPYGYKDIRPGLSQEEVFVKVLYYDKIYPSSKLTISDVRARLRYRVDNEGNRIRIGGTDEEPVYEQYAIWYFQIGGFTFDSYTIIEGKNPSASFESGQLAGRDFELEYHEKAETVKDGNDVTPFEINAGDYEIIIDESTGSIIPGLSYIIPQEGDIVILFNIVMPEEYTKSAQDELEEKLDKYLVRQEEDNRIYRISSNPVYFYENKTDLRLGQSVTFVYGGMSVSTRIQSVEKRLDLPCYQDIGLGNKVLKGVIQKLKDDVAYTNQQIDIIKAFNELSVSLTNAYANAQREMIEGFAAIKKLWSLKEDDEGNQYAYTKLPIVGAAGLTLFAGEQLKVDSIFKGLPLDTTTLQWVDGVLTVVGGTGGASNWDELEGKPSWITDIKPVYTWGEITQKPTTLSGYGIQASDVLNTIKSVDGSESGLDADLLDGHDSKFFVNFLGNSDFNTITQGYIKAYGTKATNTPYSILGGNQATVISVNPNDSAYSGQLAIGFGYPRLAWRNKSNGGAWTDWVNIIAGSADKLVTPRTIWGQSFDGTANVTGSLTHVTDITGTGTFTGANIKATDSVYVNGIRLHKTADGVITLEGNLAVTGGITTHAIGEQTTATIMDGIAVDGITITKEDGVLKVVGGGGASNWDELEGKPSWITDIKPVYTWGEITQKPTTLSGYGIQASDVLNTIKSVDGSESGLDADLLDGHDSKFFVNFLGNSDFNTITQGYIKAYGTKATNTPYSILGGNQATVISVNPNDSAYSGQLAIGFGYPRLAWRNKSNGGAWTDWVNIIAGSADKLVTPRTIWGQSFDGTANVTGSLTHVTDITGTGTFTGANIKATDSVYVNGIRLHKTADGVITLEGNLAVTGGITQFAVNEVNPSTIMDGVVVDGTSIKKENGVLKVMNAGGGEAGSVKWTNINGKPTTLTGYGISASDVLSTLKTVDGSGSGLDADLLDGQHSSYFLSKYGVNNTSPGGYVTNDTHILQLGYMVCGNSYDSLTLQIQSAFWGNQHGSSDIISISQDTNTNSTGTVQYKASRLKIGNTNQNRIFYAKADNTNKRLYLYVYVTGGNGYGRWVTQIISASRTNMWVSEIKTNQSSSDLTIIQERFEVDTISNADKLDGVHLNGLFTALSSTSSTNLSATIGGVTKTVADLYATQAVNADTVDNYHAIGASGNIIKKRGYTGGSTTPYWYRLAKYSTTNTENNTDVAFFLHSSFDEKYGILLVRLRGGEYVDPYFLVSYGMSTTKIRVYYDSTKKNVELYYYASENYSIMIAELLYNTHRNGTISNDVIMYENNNIAPSYSTYINPTFISIQNNSDSATKLQTARNLWGQSFDGTKDVTGSMTVNGNITIANGSGSTLTIWDSSAYLRQQNISDLGGYGLYLYGSSGTRIANKLVVDSNAYFKGNVGIGTISPSYKLDVNGTCRVTSTSVFNGNVGIGTTSPSQKLHVAGNILATGGGTFYSSDIRAKTIIERPKLSLNSIANSPVIKFRWNGYSDLKDDGKLHIGGVAQYIEKILPECVIGQKDDFLSFDYATTGYVFSVLTARHLLSYETRTDRIIRKLKERIKRLEKQLNIENHEEVSIVAD